jgi:hypothetical protein
MNIENKIESLTKSGLWKFSNDILYVKKVAWIPVARINSDLILIFFSKQIQKEVIKVIKLFSDEKFYLISPLLIFESGKNFYSYRTPSDELHKVNLENYLNNYAESYFYHQFRKIEFDMISNMVSYCNHFNCFYLFKDIYDDINKKVNKETWDYYTNKKYYKYESEIRDEFNGMYRQIRINQIIN